MGRSVETVSDAEVVYFETPAFGEFDDLCINLQSELEAKYKSFVQCDKWLEYPYRENRIILENYHVSISISGYISVGAVSIFTNKSSEYPELSNHWLSQNIEGIKKIIGQFTSVVYRQGTMSNGVSVYRK